MLMERSSGKSARFVEREVINKHTLGKTFFIFAGARHTTLTLIRRFRHLWSPTWSSRIIFGCCCINSFHLQDLRILIQKHSSENRFHSRASISKFFPQSYVSPRGLWWSTVPRYVSCPSTCCLGRHDQQPSGSKDFPHASSTPFTEDRQRSWFS